MKVLLESCQLNGLTLGLWFHPETEKLESSCTVYVTVPHERTAK